MGTGKRITADRALNLAAREGHRLTTIVRAGIFGSRPRVGTSGDTAYSERPAIGVPPRSVWNGPNRAARPGEPILRRAKL